MRYNNDAIKRLGFFIMVGLFAIAGCVTTSGQSGSKGASDDPTYASTSIQTHTIPYVRAEYAGNTVAVVPYVNKSLSEYRHLGDASVGILPEYLLEAGFQPVESAAGGDIDSVLSEIKYGQSDKVNPATAAMIGEQLGAKYVFIGEVNNYRVIRPKESKSMSIPFLGGFGASSGGGKITYDLQVSGRLVSVETRAIVAAKTVSHKESFVVKGGNIDTPWGSFDEEGSVEVENNVGGTVLHHALNRVIVGIVNQLNRRSLAGS